MRLLPAICLLAAVSCIQMPETGGKKEENKTPETVSVPSFAKGADISWVTEMESKGYGFFSPSGLPMECTALMKELGCNAIRLRVWVNPADGWCNKEDVLEKAKRASKQGLALMIDFHYSDWWADPGKQNPPAAWKDMNVREMASALEAHTKEVLQLLKDNKIDVAWVQVGNETNTGMCWPNGSVSSQSAQGFVTLANAGYKAVKEIFPSALVILHHSNAQEYAANEWFYGLVGAASYDMIGLSLYPSYWQDGGYPDWTPFCKAAVENFAKLNQKFKKPVMLVEFGMPASEPDKAKAAFQYVLDGVKGQDWFKGVFWWEPESEQSRNGYAYGAFKDGKSTGVIELFKNY
jgi:arabinogalactan endo-1,4-beta-galactosidase